MVSCHFLVRPGSVPSPHPRPPLSAFLLHSLVARVHAMFSVHSFLHWSFCFCGFDVPILLAISFHVTCSLFFTNHFVFSRNSTLLFCCCCCCAFCGFLPFSRDPFSISGAAASLLQPVLRACRDCLPPAVQAVAAPYTQGFPRVVVTQGLLGLAVSRGSRARPR